ncbi:MAG: recombinase family protein [Oscillospiraceae bacterium]|nr:recombinase family protein [Oscillospiraceae bacterium]
MNRQPNTTSGTTALYSRLSRDDELFEESTSITNQKAMLESYAKSHGFNNIVHYSDDGYTGTNFQRPDWKRLIADIDSGLVDTVLCKDMSRIGRDYLQTGFYTEVYFMEKGVRFIAISNNIDSDNQESTEFAPFLNIMSEWYARDSSKKIKAAKHTKGNSGKPMTAVPIYGYKRSPEDKNQWIIDEPAAIVVRRMFNMVLNGMGPRLIARTFYEEKIERPSYYFVKNNMAGADPTGQDMTIPYAWNTKSVTKMLAKPEYAGHTVNFRTSRTSYKIKRSKDNPRDEWKIFPNTHEAIVDQETFDTVQGLRGTSRRADSIGAPNPLTGLLFCADCGAKMYNKRRSAEYYTERRFGKEYKKKTEDHYDCSAYKLGKIQFRKTCCGHFIRTAAIREIVLDAIRKISSYVRQNEAEFVERIHAESVVQHAKTAKTHRKQLAQNEKRIAELDLLFQKVYEDNATGKLSDERYKQLSVAYEQEQAGLKHQNTVLKSELDTFEADSTNTDAFMKLVRKYTAFDELTTPMLNEFIRKIVVHRPDKSSGERVQKVDIHFNFIGNFELPQEEPTPEEIEANAILIEKLLKKREANRRYNEKYNAKQREKYRLEQEALMATV